MSIYNDFDACNEFCILLLYILPYVMLCNVMVCNGMLWYVMVCYGM